MAKVIIIAGDTGSGKSASIEKLDSKETYIINVLNKPLPFKGSNKIYNAENKNINFVSEWNVVLEGVTAIATKRPEIKHLIIDDVGFVMTAELFKRAKETGYARFTDIGVHMQQLLDEAKKQRDDLNIFFMFHIDDDINDKIKVGKKLKTIGMMLEDKYNPMAIVSICLFTEVVFNKEGNAEYNFITNRTMSGNIIIPAKTPKGMFSDLRIPNDLSLVVKAVNEYYN